MALNRKSVGLDLIRYWEEIFYCKSGEALKEAAREGVGVPSLEVFKGRLVGTLSNLV